VDDRVWKNISIALGVVCALLIGVAGALLFLGHKGGSAAATPSSATADVGSGPTSSGGSNGPSGSSSPNASGPTPAPGPVSAATISFSNLALDSDKDPLKTIRTFTFTSDGSGPVIPKVTGISKGGWVTMCFKVDDGVHKAAFNCHIGGATSTLPKFSSVADATPDTWTVTLVGYRTSKPTVSVSFTWPTSNASINLTHARFQGTSGASTPASDALGGITATFQPRAIGTLNVQATWTLATTDATMTLLDATTSPAVMVDQRPYAAVDHITPAFTANVDPAKTYQIKLIRSGADSTDRPDMTAQISFP
jgi:hypothetical protein